MNINNLFSNEFRESLKHFWGVWWSNRLLFFGTLVVLFLSLIAIFVNVLPLPSPTETRASAMFSPPSPDFLLGTDQFGRSLFSRIMHGIRISFSVAFPAIAFALSVGGILGLLSGYAGGGWDTVLGRFMDVLFSFPPIVLAIAISGTLGTGARNAIFAIGVVYTPMFYRVSRSGVLREKEEEYVEAAYALGASSLRIIFRHLPRNIFGALLVQSAIALSYAMLLEAALSFLGLGVQPPQPSLGAILKEGRTYLEMAPWISLIPGGVIMMSVMSFNLVGDGLRDWLDPKTRTQTRV